MTPQEASKVFLAHYLDDDCMGTLDPDMPVCSTYNGILWAVMGYWMIYKRNPSVYIFN